MTNRQTNEFPSVSELGEQGILDAMLPLLATRQATLGPGDDAGALKVEGGEVIVSVDTLVENQDFRLSWPSGFKHRAYDVGWKSIAQNVSDINAMGGVPTGAVVSLSLPGDLSVEWVKDFAAGVAAAVESLGASEMAIVGGDLGRSTEISITTTVLGECRYGKVLRSGARTGDLIAVAGRLGSAGAGLAVLESSKQWQSWNRSVRRLVDAQCRPEPPLASGPRAAEAGATSMMDISDGLLRDAERLAKSSKVNFNFNSRDLEAFKARLEPASLWLKQDSLSWVLEGGEDFGLLATFPAAAEIPEEFAVIGEVQHQPGRRSLTKIDGEVVNGSHGFDHFKTRRTI
ncbi:thiamine-phosphate kinase [Glutamicibacter sp.]|uniref:thiamine-phosphate kinase n=1 Tax=Glutamicibacter sp. TaxID=1931995 RepID=UPI0028BF0644|nr:thiamine-phosphate kinase [Glutamicibacter sp.]